MQYSATTFVERGGMAMICFSANSIEEDVAAASEAWVPAEADPGAMGVPESVVHSPWAEREREADADFM